MTVTDAVAKATVRIQLRPIIFGEITISPDRRPQWRVLVEEKDTGEHAIVSVPLCPKEPSKDRRVWEATWNGRPAALIGDTPFPMPHRVVLVNISETTTRVVQAAHIGPFLLPCAALALQEVIEAFPNSYFAVIAAEYNDLHVDLVIPCTVLMHRYYTPAINMSFVSGGFVCPRASDRKMAGLGPCYRAIGYHFIGSLLRYNAIQIVALPPMHGTTVMSVIGMVFGYGSSKRQYVVEQIHDEHYGSELKKKMRSLRCGGEFVEGVPFNPDIGTEEWAYEQHLAGAMPDFWARRFRRAPSLDIGYYDRTGYHVGPPYYASSPLQRELQRVREKYTDLDCASADSSA